MRFVYWIKFENSPPQRFTFKHLDDMWFNLREMMMREPQRYGLIEWMIRE